ncbi:hypothetical protein O7602_15820 [Micromonospora sp. WMMD1128]|uniref:hypothetical protein n=1 Tax=Micromonospora sp. WMMD1128 TaxID=3015150 RepID=UPI00248B3DE4|nr:hypothetical protein [Micromonospora sp. WMMD1128]WBB71229.1 hypothetical protein O7602_15820 [Micromonospora sp. WMMD1128]
MELAGLIIGVAGVMVTLAGMLRGRGKLIVAGSGVLLILVATALVFLPPMNSGGSAGRQPMSPNTAGSRTSGTSRSTDDDLLLEENFHTADRGWQVGHDNERGTARYELGQLRIQPNPGFAKWITAPIHPVPAGVRISAKAHLEAGQGGWGIWCRGIADNSRQYEFSVTHAGDAYIKNGYELALAQTNIPGFDVTRENTMTVDCRDAAGGVQLTMSINGDVVLSAQSSDGAGDPLGPGPVGLHAFAFGDAAGAPADVRFSYFEAVRLR